MVKILKTVLDYCEDIASGKIISCTKHKQACKRFTDDLERSKTSDFPYTLDAGRAALFLDWAALFSHTKGVLAGKKIELLPAYQFVVLNIYGWYHKETGYRRFTKMYFQVGRKNMKSQFNSLIALYECFVFSKDLSEVYTAATKRKQAKVVYDECVRMLREAEKTHKDFKGVWKETYGIIEHIGAKGSGSFITTLSAEDQQKGDAYNPQCAIIDEYHLHENNGYVSAMDTGMAARLEPLLSIITTAGFDLSRPCYTQEYNLVKRILDPDNPTMLENVFCDIHEMETNDTEDVLEINGKRIAPGDLIDEITIENLSKANPVVCSYPEGIKNLKDQYAKALEIPEQMRDFLTKHCNIWVNQREAGYMPLARWTACGCRKIPEAVGAPCWIGLDLSAKIDLTSMGVVVPFDRKYLVYGHSFMPETTFNARMAKHDKIPFDLWEKQGYLTITPGDVVNYRMVVEHCKDFVQKLGLYVREWCVDPWGSLQISSDLIAEGQEVVDIIQGIKTLSEPTKTFRNEVYDQNIIHDNNPLVTWAIGNAVIDTPDKNLNSMLNKKKSVEKIDPIAAIINAFVRAMISDTIDCGYNQHSMRSLV